MDKNPAILNHAEIESFADRLFHAELNLEGITVDEQQCLRLLAAEALFHFHRNQFDSITLEQQAAITKLYKAVDGKVNKLLAPIPLLSIKKAKQKHSIAGVLINRLEKLIDSCIHEHFPIDWALQASHGQLVLGSPFSKNLATCRESYELQRPIGLQSLRFIDEDKTFFLMQIVATADALFLPEAHILIALEPAHSVTGFWVERLYIKLFCQFTELCAYAKNSKNNQFLGFVASHHRPAHYYYEVFPAVYEIYHKLHDVTFISRVPDLDFNDLSFLFDDCQYLKLTSDELDNKTRANQGWVMHVGVSRLQRLHRYGLYLADQALIAKVLASPTATALFKAKQVAGCYPLVWVGIEGQKRCWIEQIDGYAYMLNQLAQHYPNLGVVIDGWTLPFTPSEKSLLEADKDRAITDTLIQKLKKTIKSTVVVGETSNTKLFVGYRVDFFICNYATGSLYVSRMLEKPGFCHWGHALAKLTSRAGMQIHPNRHVYLLPKHLTHDMPEFSLTVYDKTKTLMTKMLAAMKKQSAPKDMVKRNAGAVSYSIDKQEFYSFIDQHLPQVLANKPSTKVDLFIELPFTASPSLRPFFKMATHGNIIIINPEQKHLRTINELVELPSEFLCRHVIYGHLGLKAHEALSLDGDYSIWLREPLDRLRLHVGQLSKAKQLVATDNFSVLTSGIKKLDNPYTRLLSGQNAPFGKCTETMLQAALERLAQLKFIGCVEKTAASFDALCATFNWDRTLFPNKLNDTLTQSSALFGTEEMELAEPLIVFDKMLYEFVLSSRYGG